MAFHGAVELIRVRDRGEYHRAALVHLHGGPEEMDTKRWNATSSKALATGRSAPPGAPDWNCHALPYEYRNVCPDVSLMVDAHRQEPYNVETHSQQGGT